MPFDVYENGQIVFTQNPVAFDAPIGTVVGTIAVINAAPTYKLSVGQNPYFAISGNNLVSKAALVGGVGFVQLFAFKGFKRIAQAVRVVVSGSAIPNPPTPSTFAIGISLVDITSGGFTTTAEIDYAKAKGCTFVRLVFGWEQIQPTLLGDLNSTILGYITNVVAYCQSVGLKCWLDLHNYGRYSTAASPGMVLGGGTAPGDLGVLTTAQYNNLWMKIATAMSPYAGPLLAFDIMNEPHDIAGDGPTWTVYAESCRAAIRTIDTTTEIIIDGYHYANTYDWALFNPDIHTITDAPYNNVTFSGHMYPDPDDSGGGNGYDADHCRSVGDLLDPGAPLDENTGVKRLTPFFAWAILRGKRINVGESGIAATFGVPDNIFWFTQAKNTIDFCLANGVQFCAWAGGQFWGAYAYSLNPGTWISSTSTADSEQWALLTRYTGAAQPTIYFLTGPSNGTVSTPSTNFTVPYRGLLATPVVVTPNDNGALGSFTPSSVTLAANVYNPVAVFTYTPPAGAMTTRIDVTNNLGFTNPSGIVFSTEVDLFASIAIPQNIISDIQLYASYIGPCRQMRRNSDGAILDFGFAGQGLGVANLGRTLDTAAIATWAPGGAKTVKRYSQEPVGNHMLPVFNTDTATPSSTSDYPAFAIDTDGFPSDTFSSNRMDMTSPLHGATGQTIIANYNFGSGSGSILNWDFLGQIQFGPSVYQYSDGLISQPVTLRHPVNEQGSMSLGTVVGEYHIHASTWQANSATGWRTWKDGTQFAANQTYATELTTDFGRSVSHIGYNIFTGANISNCKVRDMIVWNTAIPDANNVAIQNFLSAHYATIQPTSIAWDIMLDFEAGVYTNGGSSISVSSVIGSGSINSQGLLNDTNASLIGAAFTMVNGNDFTLMMETNLGPASFTGNLSLLRLSYTGSTWNDLYMNNSFVVSANATIVFGSEQDMTRRHRYAISRNSVANNYSAFSNGVSGGSGGTAPATGYISGKFGVTGNNPSTFRITKLYIKAGNASQIQMLNATDVLGTPGAALPSWLPGMNSAGGAFGAGGFWMYDPSIDYYHQRGLKLIRLAFLWQEVQTSLNGSLDPTILAQFDRIIARATGYGMTVLLDCHNFGGYSGTAHIGDAGGPTMANLVNLWGQIAARYSANPNVAFDLMNEPGGVLTKAQWYSGMQDCITAIRGTGASGLILIPSYGFSSSTTHFTSDGNSDAFLAQGFTDSNCALTNHIYLDSTGGGAGTDAVRYTGRNRCRSVVTWCRANGVKFFLGEIGVSNAPSQPWGALELGDMLSFLKSSNDVCIGYSYWAGGPAWTSNYMYLLEPFNPANSGIGGWTTAPYGERPQMGVMRMYL